jgi:hypothetical protein
MNLQVYVYLRRYGLGNLDLRYFNTCAASLVGFRSLSFALAL